MIAINFDPIARGYVSSLARPGGNVTGIFFRQLELAQSATLPCGARAAMAETRKLAAILAAEVVGYSKLASSDEERLLGCGRFGAT
jgi:hypothetical protein